MIKDTLNIQVIAWDTWTRKGFKTVNPADSVYWDTSYNCVPINKLQVTIAISFKWVYVVSQLINAPFFFTLYSKTCPLTKGACMSSNLIYLMQVYLSPRPSPGAVMMLIGSFGAWRTERDIGEWTVPHCFLSYLHVEISDIEGHIAALFPFNLSDLKCKHPHRCTLHPFQLLPVISP